LKQNLTIIRQTLRDKRSSLPLQFIQQSSAIISAKIINSQIFQQSKNIAFYLATENEVDVYAVIQKAWQQKKSCYLPIIQQVEKNSLVFIQYERQDSLQKNQWGILEPQFDEKKLLSPQNLDLVIVPLAGFNDDNYRLGRGAGFYDNTFAFKLKNPQTKPYLLGVAFEFQKTAFTPNSWDVPLQEVLTEK
jgi:5-formyltetrahydrofolate cyclo-ligase